MDKNHIKKILMSMRNIDNESQVNFLLGKIDLLSEEEFNTMLTEIGNSDENLISFFKEKLNSREKITFARAKDTLDKILQLLNENHMQIYVVGGIVPYLLLDQDSGRLHDDIDTICKLEDIDKLREFFIKQGLHNPNWDSKTYAKDGKDYGFEMKVDGVPFAICPFEYKDGTVTQYSFDPYTKECKIKTIPIVQISDFIYSYKNQKGKEYDIMSLEYIKLTKDNTRRPKDIIDSEVISKYGIRKDVMDRITMYKETQKERFE